jgi:hypothetical protein
LIILNWSTVNWSVSGIAFVAGALSAGGIKRGNNSVDQIVSGIDLMASSLSVSGICFIRFITTPSSAVEFGIRCIIASGVE